MEVIVKLKFFCFYKVMKFKCFEIEMVMGKLSKCNKVLKMWYFFVYCVNCNLREFSFGVILLLCFFKICGFFCLILRK